MHDRHQSPPGHGGPGLNPLSSSTLGERFRALVEESRDAVIIAGADGRCVAANPAAASLLGYERDELLGLDVSTVFARELDCAGATRARALVAGQWSGELQVHGRDGEIVSIDAWSMRVSDPSGDTSILFLRNVDDRVGTGEAGAELAAAEASNATAAVDLTIDGTIAGWSPAAERLYGYPAWEAVGRPAAMLAPPERLDDVAGLLEQVQRGEPVAAYRTVHLTRTGCRIDVCLEVSPVRNTGGDVAAVSWIVRDVIGCMRAEQELEEARATAKDANTALRESEERFRGAFDGASIGMALVSPDGRFLQVNPALCGIIGYSEDELLVRTFREITPAGDLAVGLELERQLLAGDIGTYQIEKRYLRKDGQTICGRLTISLVRDPAGNPRYFVAQIQDITPYKTAGRALREAEARYRTLVEQIPAAVYVDAGESLGTPLYISPRIVALLGYTPEEWVDDPGLWIRALHPHDRERILNAIAEADDAGQASHLEYRILARDGREVWIHNQVALVRDEEGAGQYWQGFMVDVTDRKRVEEELREAKEAAEQASRLKSAFLSMATHELRTPLTIISGYVELLAESATAHLTSDEREFLDIMQSSTRTLAALVDDLLDLARIEAGRLELAIRPVDVAQAVERVHRMVAAQAAAKGIVLETAVTPNLPAVAADFNRLIQVLLNLLGNAVKFTEQGSVRTTVRSSGQGVEIRVTDTGIGISPETLPRIFDEFRQADAGTTRKFGGSGLGLAIAKRLVEMQGGTIAVASHVSVGSTFTIWLPVADPHLLAEYGMTGATGVSPPLDDAVQDVLEEIQRSPRQAMSQKASS